MIPSRPSPDTPFRLHAGAPAGSDAPPAPHAVTPEASPPERASIRSWLDLLTSLLDLPEAERAAVRDELDSHLRDRVRDLTLAGMSEPAASARALSELGDAALLARRFKEAIEPSKRRLIMNGTALTIAGAAILFSSFALFQSSGGSPSGWNGRNAVSGDLGTPVAAPSIPSGPASTPPGQPAIDPVWLTLKPAIEAGELRLVPTLEPAPPSPEGAPNVWRRFDDGLAEPRTYAPPDDDSTRRLRETKLTMVGEVTWEQFFAAVGTATGLTPVVQWDRLQEIGVGKQDRLKVGTDIPVATVLAEENADRSDLVAACIENDRIIFAPESIFDRQDQTLVAYDLSALIARRRIVGEKKPEEVIDEVCGLITHLVENRHWIDAGGDRASSSRFDATLFIQAPRRFHDKIQWIMRQLHASAALTFAPAVPVVDAPTPALPQTHAGPARSPASPPSPAR
ncbi:MAG: permease prefix domain 1-containing protein [Phycisphaerales bacterium]